MSDHLKVVNPESHWVTVQMSSKQVQFISWLAAYHIRTGSNPDSIAQSKALLRRLANYERPPVPGKKPA